VALGNRAVLALIEEQPGLLTMEQVDLEREAPDRDLVVSGTSPHHTTRSSGSPSSARSGESATRTTPRGFRTRSIASRTMSSRFSMPSVVTWTANWSR